MIVTIKNIEEAILKIDNEIVKLQDDKQNLINSKEVLFKTNNICPECMGKRYYYRKSDRSDPYERSSDLQEKCPKCNGTGQYMTK